VDETKRNRRAVAAFVWASMLPVGSAVTDTLIIPPEDREASGFSDQDRDLLRGWFADYATLDSDGAVAVRVERGQTLTPDDWAQHRPLPSALSYAMSDAPQGTLLVRIGEHAVRVRAATMTVLDSVALA